MKRAGLGLIVLAATCLPACQANRSLDLYFIDMVGGAAMLAVTPQGESILVDSGSALERDASRILATARKAGLSRIDHVVTTHWHRDHYGALGLMEGRIPFGRFYDRGIPESVPEDPEHFPELIAAYRIVTKGESTTLRAGDEIALTQGDGPPIRLRCIMASGEVAPDPDGPPPDAVCVGHAAKPPDPTENGKSIVLLLSFGSFDLCHTGDLTWNLEHRLVCPLNRIGPVEVLQVSHHGFASSSNPVFIRAVMPKVAIVCNGPRKGGDPEVIRTLRLSPGLEDIWQLHRNHRTSEADNAPRCRVANWDDEAGGRGIKLSVTPSGRAFSAQIEPGGEPVHYRWW